MKNHYPSFGWIRAGAFALVFTATTAMFGQGVTTSGISGFVTDKDGKPVARASVTVIREDSGTRCSATTRCTGQYNMSGLIPGGPYTVTATAPGFPPVERKEIYLDLGATG